MRISARRAEFADRGVPAFGYGLRGSLRRTWLARCFCRQLLVTVRICQRDHRHLLSSPLTPLLCKVSTISPLPFCSQTLHPNHPKARATRRDTCSGRTSPVVGLGRSISIHVEKGHPCSVKEGTTRRTPSSS